MDHRLASMRKWLCARKKLLLWLAAAAGLLALMSGILLASSSPGRSGGVLAASRWRVRQQEPLPTYNWFVCGDLGTGTVPGIPGLVQRLELCHHHGWRVLAYCIEPEKPAPPLDTTCALTINNTFWCGDENQLLLEYQVAETPTPGPTETPTQVPTETPTETQTSTPRPTETASPTPASSSTPTASQMPSPLPTETPTLTATTTPPSATPSSGTVPPSGITPTPFGGASPGPSSTPRTPPGGQGNLLVGSLALLMSAAALTATLVSVLVLFWWRRQP
jgi:hypothetical protein